MSQQPPPKKKAGNIDVIKFTVLLSFICALILSVLASVLAKPIEVAKELDRSEQMLIASRVLSHKGYFLIKNNEGDYTPAKFTKGGILVPGKETDIPTRSELLEVYNKRIAPFLVNHQGELSTFKEQGINEQQYVGTFQAEGYYKQPWMLIYKVLPNPKSPKENENAEEEKADGWVIPVNGYGLWDAIYGYLAIQPNMNIVTGISWYEQKETPGLGANIADAPWQSQFPGKHIFQETPEGTTDFKTAPLGITVVKGKVSEVLGNIPKALSAVDGMAGATLTGNGVTLAYKDVLAPYRPFLIKMHEKSKSNDK